MLVCGRYEGFDERVRAFVDEEVSLGDFVLTGGEVAAMAIIEGVVAALARRARQRASTPRSRTARSATACSSTRTTRGPRSSAAMPVPEVLAGGNHAEIARYRREQAYATHARAPPRLAPCEPPDDGRR